MDAQTKPNVATLISWALALRKRVADKTKAYEDSIKEDSNSIEQIENILLDEINKLGGQSIKTIHGTAYRSTITSFRVADRQTWLDWVFVHDQRDMLTTHVAKDAIKDYQEQNGDTPPGLNVTTIHKCNIRSAD